MDMQLKGQKAIVTGGTAGIGLAIARALSEEGVEVTIPGRNSKKLNEAIVSLAGAVRGIEVDVGTAEGAAKLIEQVPETNILVNNLGIYELKNFSDITDDEWLNLFEINVLSGIRLARHYFPRMLAKNSGRVIFISSESGIAIPIEMVHYGMTKAAQLAIFSRHGGTDERQRKLPSTRFFRVRHAPKASLVSCRVWHLHPARRLNGQRRSFSKSIAAVHCCSALIEDREVANLWLTLQVHSHRRQMARPCASKVACCARKQAKIPKR